MESILKQYYPDMDMAQFEREMTGFDYVFKIQRDEVILDNTLHEWEPRCYEDLDEDVQDYYNKETSQRLIQEFILDMNILKMAMIRARLTDDVERSMIKARLKDYIDDVDIDDLDDVDIDDLDDDDIVGFGDFVDDYIGNSAEDKLYYDMLVCYLLKNGHLKSDNVKYRTLFMWDVWCLYQPQNVASYLETVEVDDLWNLHYSLSLYSYLAWQEIKRRCRSETLFQKPVFRRF